MNNLKFQTDLTEYLPEWYRPVLDYQAILAAEETEFTGLEAEVLAVYGNMFFRTADAGTISMWEAVFKITPDPSDSLEFRRERILNRISMKPPFTIRFLENQLDRLIGEGEYTITVDPANYTLIVDTVSANQPYAIEVSYTINHTKPAHIIYINRPNLYYEIDAAEKIDQINNDWNYILGSWYLGQSPFIAGSTIVEVKMASTPSIKNLTLNSLASDLAALISKARINGSIIVSLDSCSATNNVVTVEYTVAPAQANQVTQIELLDSSNNVLTSSGVYVPITEATTFKHTIPVKEGTNGN